MSILTHTHRATQVPDEPTAPLIDKVDTTHTEHPWSLITGLITLIGVAGAAVLVVAA